MVGVPALRPETFSRSFSKNRHAQTRKTEAIKHTRRPARTPTGATPCPGPTPGLPAGGGTLRRGPAAGSSRRGLRGPYPAARRHVRTLGARAGVRTAATAASGAGARRHPGRLRRLRGGRRRCGHAPARRARVRRAGRDLRAGRPRAARACPRRRHRGRMPRSFPPSRTHRRTGGRCRSPRSGNGEGPTGDAVGLVRRAGKRAAPACVRRADRGAPFRGVLARDASAARLRGREARARDAAALPGSPARGRRARVFPLDADGARPISRVFADAYGRWSAVVTASLGFFRRGGASETAGRPPP